MSIKEQLEKDLKTAMLAGEKDQVTTLRGLKSTILYAEVAAGKRDEGLSEAEVINLLQKEAKKRQESADFFTQGKNDEKAAAELSEKQLIEHYLPAQLSEPEVAALVDEAISSTGATTMQHMGQVMAAVKKTSGGNADGALVARLVKEKLST